MCLLCQIGYVTTSGAVAVAVATSPSSNIAQFEILRSLGDAITSAATITVVQPEWYKNAVDQASQKVTYHIETRGTITADVDEFSRFVATTLQDGRGWVRMGVQFEEVASGGDFTIVLSEASQVTTFSQNGCDASLSCRVGRYVVINQDRWKGGTDVWSNAGGNLIDYRRMVINHEVGHWLGHEHEACTAAGAPAPVMRQQSVDLGGCAPNAWPLDSELWSTQLGIEVKSS